MHKYDVSVSLQLIHLCALKTSKRCHHQAIKCYFCSYMKQYIGTQAMRAFLL